MNQEIKIITKDNPVSVKTLKELSQKWINELVKAIVDIDKQIMVIGAEMHADQEAFLLATESKKEYVWGINIYPQRPKKRMDRI